MTGVIEPLEVELETRGGWCAELLMTIGELVAVGEKVRIELLPPLDPFDVVELLLLLINETSMMPPPPSAELFVLVRPSLKLLLL